MLTCKAILRKGNRRCSRSPGDDGFCYQHRKIALPITPIIPKGDPIETAPISTTCSVCLDELTIAENAGLSCRHALHLTCAEQLRDPHCPNCREVISSANSKLNESQIEVIKSRCLQDKDERAEESFQTFLEEEEQEDGVQNGPIELNEDFLLQLLIAQGTVAREQAALPIGGNLNPNSLIEMIRQERQKVVNDPIPGSAEEMAILSWILDCKVVGKKIDHEALHERYPNYSCPFLSAAEIKVDSFLDE